MELFKKKFESFWKRLILQDFFKLCLDFYYCSWVLKTFKFWFFGKRDVFLEEHLKVFKNTKHGYFPSECFPKVIIAHAISKSLKHEFFWKKMTSFAEISLKDFRSTIWHFYRDCVSDFHDASEFSKQSKFWFVWRNRCCLWKDPYFSLESINVAFLSQLAFKKHNCPRELKTFISLRFPGK